MSPIESVVAHAEIYQRVHELLLIEEAVLAVMRPRGVESRPAVIAQMARIAALRVVEDRFACDTVNASGGPSS